MKAFIFSIGEKTTDLCCELMTEYGFEVILYQDGTTLWDKLKRFYTEALESDDEEFFRIDADIIPSKNVKQLQNLYPWTCAWGLDWYKQDLGSISIHRMHRDIIEKCLLNIDEARRKIRPETYLWRLPEINEFTTNAKGYFGIHGYGQANHRERIKHLKYLREQEYDWGLVERIESL